MKYTIHHRARQYFPDKSILVVEDCLLQQARFAKYLLTLFGHNSNVRVNFASTAIEAHALLFGIDLKPLLIILDHDLQFGNGCEFIKAIKEQNLDIPIFTASGIPGNNDVMMRQGATHQFIKNDIIDGKATDLILEYVGVINKTSGWEPYI